MIRFIGSNDKSGNLVVGIGLSQENLTRLGRGEPILFDVGPMGVPGLEVVICGGPTEEAIVEDLLKAGFITKDTKLSPDRAVKN